MWKRLLATRSIVPATHPKRSQTQPAAHFPHRQSQAPAASSLRDFPTRATRALSRKLTLWPASENLHLCRHSPQFTRRSAIGKRPKLCKVRFLRIPAVRYRSSIRDSGLKADVYDPICDSPKCKTPACFQTGVSVFSDCEPDQRPVDTSIVLPSSSIT